MGLQLICRSIYFNSNMRVCVCVCVVFCVHKPWRWMGKHLIPGESKPLSPGYMAGPGGRASVERACKYIYHLDLEASRASCWLECPGPQRGGESTLCPGGPWRGLQRHWWDDFRSTVGSSETSLEARV